MVFQTMTCSAGDGHCCWLNGIECEFVRASSGERKWICQLRAEHGNWDDVYTDKRYIEKVLPFWQSQDRGTLRCGDWPVTGQICGECGLSG